MASGTPRARARAPSTSTPITPRQNTSSAELKYSEAILMHTPIEANRKEPSTIQPACMTNAYQSKLMIEKSRSAC